MGKHFQISARTMQFDISIGRASVITWAFADTSGLETLLEDHDLGGVHLEGFMHACIPIHSARRFKACFARIK